MPNLYTFPKTKVIKQLFDATPSHMRPTMDPFAVIFEEYLTDSECDDIVDEMMGYEAYAFPHCGAITREAPRPLPASLQLVEGVATTINLAYWKYDLDPSPGAWFQTYEALGDYALHMDATPGQSRKLTAVALLSKPEDYTGGNLYLEAGSASKLVPKERGTVVVFPSWLLHKVNAVSSGTRQTLNMGFWGPSFR